MSEDEPPAGLTPVRERLLHFIGIVRRTVEPVTPDSGPAAKKYRIQVSQGMVCLLLQRRLNEEVTFFRRASFGACRLPSC
ncbi:MAG: hypothetical protein HY749_19450 [Gammaproteobacteria bacterium]|nr:hypothetical protein [Gammaproteobacteria bacterium]